MKNKVKLKNYKKWNCAHCLLVLFWGLLNLSFTKINAQESIDSLLVQIQALSNANQFQEMIDVSEQGLSIASNTTPFDSLATGNFYWQKANALYGLKDYLAALPIYNLAIQYSPNDAEGLNLKGQVLFDRAFAEYMLEDYVVAYQTVKKAEAILSQLANPDYDYLLSIYADLGGEAHYLGYVKEAEYYLAKGLKLLKANEGKVIYRNDKQASKAVLFAHKTVALYDNVQEKAKIGEQKLLAALNHFEQLKRERTFNDQEQRMYAVSLGAAAQYYLVNRDSLGEIYALKRAESFLKKGLRAIDKQQFPVNYLVLKFNEVQLHLHRKEFNKAFRLNEQLANLNRENGQLAPFIYAQSGLIYLGLKEPNSALTAFKKMVQTIHQGENELTADYQNFQPGTLLNHSGLLADMGNEILKNYPKDSLLLTEANYLFHLALLQFNNCFQSGDFNQKLRIFYNRAIDGILKMKTMGYGFQQQSSDLLNTIENIENRLTWEAFVQNRQTTQAIIPDSIRYQERTLRKQLVAAKQTNDHLKISDLENQIDKFQEQLSARYPTYSTFSQQQFKLENLQENLTDSEIVLRYKVIDNNWYVFIIAKHDIRLVQLPEGIEIAKKIKQYLTTVNTMQADEQLGNWLYQQLIPRSVQTYQNWIIIPDGSLHQLPFEILLDAQKQYLVTQRPIQYASHLVFINNPLPKKTKVETQLMVFRPKYGEKTPTNIIATRGNAYRLKGAEQETRQLAELFRSTTFQDYNATTTNFIQYAPKAQWLHLAMHANINLKDPELSYLLFSDETSDYKFFLEELYALDLQADLAVLSACNTGSGKSDNRRGMISWQQAFTYAGVPATVSSLWSLPDKTTQQIIVYFYQNLKTGLDKASALQQAKIQYLAATDDANLRQPFYWAGLVFYGKKEAIIPKNSQRDYVKISILAIVVFFVMYRIVVF